MDEGRPRAAAESTANQGDAVLGPLSNPAQTAPGDTDSATGSATTTGPHTGEAWLYDWVERTLVNAVNEDGEIPDVEDLEP